MVSVSARASWAASPRGESLAQRPVPLERPRRGSGRLRTAKTLIAVGSALVGQVGSVLQRRGECPQYVTVNRHARFTQNGGATRFHAHGVDTAAKGRLVSVGAFRARVTCLEVTGNDGIATAVITSSEDPNNPVGETTVAEGVDNSAQGTTDLWRTSFANSGGIFPDAAHPECFLPIFAPVPIDAGRIRVRS